MWTNVFCHFLVIILLAQRSFGVELTFDLPDSSRECFHEEIKNNETVIFEYQVSKVNRMRLR